jgi:hypothetical protein
MAISPFDTSLVQLPLDSHGARPTDLEVRPALQARAAEHNDKKYTDIAPRQSSGKLL